MIRLPDIPLEAVTLAKLKDYQADIDVIEDYAARVSEAEKRFKSCNRKSNSTFRTIRTALSEMCCGAKRCGYCEDSAADEIEHIYPKSLYPEAVFVWENYLYSCGPCNGPKNNQFAVFSMNTGALIEVSRGSSQTILPPEPGDAVFINPRSEDALEFMQLDLCDTFYFSPSGVPGSQAYRRAEYTIETLHLNDRDYLPAARADAFRNYRARLHEYVRKKQQEESQDQLDDLISALKRMSHPTVWAEMKRQHQYYPNLRQLFALAPEAQDW